MPDNSRACFLYDRMSSNFRCETGACGAPQGLCGRDVLRDLRRRLIGADAGLAFVNVRAYGLLMVLREQTAAFAVSACNAIRT